jgi:poly [ADP-ribose] polymerase 2/3/4
MSLTATIYRRFQCTDIQKNNNKYWQIEFWEANNRCRVVYGRVGAETVEESTRTRAYVESKIAEKLRKGYVELDLRGLAASASAAASALDPKVAKLIDLIYSEAAERIAEYLATGLDALSPEQIGKGRQLLLKAQKLQKARRKKTLLQAYYNLIPTRLPRKIEADTLMRDFDFAEQENRLNQLETALATQTTGDGVDDRYRRLGTEISPLPQTAPAYEQIVDSVARTSAGLARIRDIFRITVPHERAAWDACAAGKHHIVSLFHGTRNPNIRHILNKGLIIPKIATNGSRFGRGVYFADQSRRSINYTGSHRTAMPRMMFVADVALGTPCQLAGDNPILTEAPSGYDSVWGVQSWSGMDEFIIYNTAQQTIRALVLFD